MKIWNREFFGNVNQAGEILQKKFYIKGTLNVNMNDIESLFTNTIALRKRKFVLFSQMTRDTNIVFIKMYITIFLTQTFKNFA